MAYIKVSEVQIESLGESLRIICISFGLKVQE